MQDRRLRGAPREVYVFLHRRLDVGSFRPVKLDVVIAECEIARGTASEAFARLITCGYIEARNVDGRSRAYRLVNSLAVSSP